MLGLRAGSALRQRCPSTLHNTLLQTTITPHIRNYAQEARYKPSVINEALQRAKIDLKTYKPITPGRRHLKLPLHTHLWPGRPLRSLTVAQRKTGGRNNTGRITVRSRGGGHRRRIRLVDFMRLEHGPHDVVRIEYDPGRSAHIALTMNRDPDVSGLKKWNYILAPDGLRAGDVVRSFRQGVPDGFLAGYDDRQAKKIALMRKKGEEITLAQENEQLLSLGALRALTLKTGNVVPLRLIPTGTIIHSICLRPEGRAVLVRAAGTWAQVMDSDHQYAHVRLQSGEVRKILLDCCATVGQVSNGAWKFRNLGKAGRSRWLGRRPHVRGVAMNACDHPHGGGRGKSKSNKHPVSVWGWATKGKRTRKPGPKGPKNSNKYVLSERPRGKQKQGSHNI